MHVQIYLAYKTCTCLHVPVLPHNLGCLHMHLKRFRLFLNFHKESALLHNEHSLTGYSGITMSICLSASPSVCLPVSLCLLWHSIPQRLMLMFREKYYHYHVRVFFIPLSLSIYKSVCLNGLVHNFYEKKCQKLIHDTKVACDLRA